MQTNISIKRKIERK